jgi:Putative peptidoglycan binding domain/L,D-transpeptidase catalytic domain
VARSSKVAVGGVAAAVLTLVLAGCGTAAAERIVAEDPAGPPSARSKTTSAPATATSTPTPTPTRTALYLAGDASEGVRELQARLKQLQWYAPEITGEFDTVTLEAVTGFQAKRGLPATGEVDQATWDRLVDMTRQPTDDEMHSRVSGNGGSAAGLDPRCTSGRAMCIDKSTRSLRWVVSGSVLMTLDVRFGSELTPTREGAFSVGYKSRDHVSQLYGTPMPYAMFFSGGQAVHYSPDFAANGYNGSPHGCVNVRNLGAIASLFDQVLIGDKVIVYWS